MRSNTFDIPRLSNFIRRQVTLNAQSMLITAGAVFGALLVISLLVTHFNPTATPELKNLYLVVYFLGGLIFTSRIFTELHSPQRSYAYLTLPVSTTEKLIGSWLLSTLVYMLVYWLLAGIVYLIATLTVGITIVDLFNGDFFKHVASYLLIQPVFFLGAVYFRSHNFVKTLLSMFVFLMIIGLYTGLLAWLFFGGSVDGRDFSGGDTTLLGNVIDVIGRIAQYLLVLFLLVVSYFSLKERQV